MRGVACLGIVSVLCSAPAWAAKLTVGEEVPITLASPRVASVRDRAELVWSETISDPRATYVALHFARFELAPGDQVVVRSPDGARAWRYEGLGRAALGKSEGGFWSSHVKGNAAVVEYWSRGGGGDFGFAIDRFARGFTSTEIELHNPGLNPGADPDLPEPEAICGVDDSEWAPCYEDTEPVIYEKSRAVARLLINGTGGCTGWLLGCNGHLVTNNHCIGGAGDAANTDYEFMAEGATCETNCASFGACDGTIVATTATFVQTGVGLDFTLVQLPGNPSDDYGYMQFRDTGPVVDERIYIPQHAAAWGKRIAVRSTHVNDESGFCEIFGLNHPPCSGGPGDIGYYADTQGGSSGSPVLAFSDHRVVSLHHCANCANRGTDSVDIIAELGSNLPPCAVDQLAGTLELDRAAFRCADAVSITVRDDSLQGAGSLVVTIASDSETAGETVTLVEGDAGVFAGTIATVTAPPASDGVLSVSHGDALDVVYVDADDGSGGVDVQRVATAAVDCVAPAIENVAASDVSGNAATITWTTDEPADSLVEVGSGSVSASDSDLVTGHSLLLLGAPECSTNYFSVTSADEAGNRTTDTGGTELHHFVTGVVTGAIWSATDTPRPIPPASPTGVTSTLDVLDANTVADVNVRVDIDHNATGELSLYLATPSGGQILLAKKRGGTGNDFIATVFDDQAASHIASASPPFTGSFRPEQPLGSIDGTGAAGPWRLRVINDSGGTGGSLLGWELRLTYPDEPCAPPDASPPPVPDGTNATEPVTIERLASGALRIDWDTDCAPVQTNLLYGPLDQVSSYAVTGALCDVADGVVWDTPPSGNLWILLVGENGESLEGSWGHATAGERNGAVASGMCGNSLKDPSGSCP